MSKFLRYLTTDTFRRYPASCCRSSLGESFGHTVVRYWSWVTRQLTQLPALLLLLRSPAAASVVVESRAHSIGNAVGEGGRWERCGSRRLEVVVVGGPLLADQQQKSSRRRLLSAQLYFSQLSCSALCCCCCRQLIPQRALFPFSINNR